MPKHVLETETKYAVSSEAELPDLADLPQVAQVTAPVDMTLDASYFDTADLALARAGITLRRRTGGADEGWHLKLPEDDRRHELHLPLNRGVAKPPVALRRIVDGVTAGAPLELVLTLVTHRRETTVLDAEGTILAIVCDDTVQASRVGEAGAEAGQMNWREWELEAHTAGPKLLVAIAKALRRAGAKRARYGSKPERALGLAAPPTPARVTVDKRTRGRDLLQPQVSRAVVRMATLDPLVRANTADAVHQMRIASRRLRGIITAFSTLLDDALAGELAAELTWLGKVLGQVRDLEVLQQHLHERLGELPPGVAPAALTRWVDTRLRQAHRSAFQQLQADLQGDRYRQLVGTLASWADAAPWTETAGKPAAKQAPLAAQRAWLELERAVKLVGKRAGTAGHEERLHDVRKAAKRVRYAAEAVQPLEHGRTARWGRAAKQIHHILGDHRDAIVAADTALELAAAAREAGKDTFALGVLMARLQAEAMQREADFFSLWRKASRLK